MGGLFDDETDHEANEVGATTCMVVVVVVVVVVDIIWARLIDAAKRVRFRRRD